MTFEPDDKSDYEALGWYTGPPVEYNPTIDHQIFTEWYEENKDYLAGCSTEKEAFYTCWEAARHMGGIYAVSKGR